MRITTLVASARRDGNTARVAAIVGERLRRLAAADDVTLVLETVFLNDLDLRPCRGCRLCFDRSETFCPLQDDSPSLKARIDASDAIIAASPVYVDDVSGIMKTWIDRMAYLCHRPGLGGKPVLLLATTGGSPTRRTLGTMRSAFSTWGACVIEARGVRGGALTPKADLSARHGRRFDRAARRLLDSANGTLPLRPSFHSLLTFRIQQTAWRSESTESLDLAYWRDRGWLVPRCTFYVAHKSTWPKTLAARLAGRALARLFI
jgi:multimeric flavodoxin WrbA